ncbi:MAG: hypothetical protein VYB58_01195 [Verrucomicrobiota bacterium]|nr:hypothetical protein [Verrucomicrobiota bacterium]
MKTTCTLITTAVMAAGLAFTHPVSAEEQREIIAMETERQLIDIEVDVLLEKFSELTKRVHQLDLERTSLEVEAEFGSNETERDELAIQLKRVSVLQDRLEEKRHQTRDEIHELRHRLAEFHGGDEGHEEEEVEEEIHHLHQEIEDLREAGKLDRAEQLQRRAEELMEHLAEQEHRRRGGRGEREELRQHFEHLQAERQEARAHLEELIVALKRVEGDGEEAKAKRHQLEDRAAEVKAHLNELNKQLEELEAIHRERREEKE